MLDSRARQAALAAMDIGPGDEVIVPSFTWVATANAVLYCNAVPVLCDVDPRTNNIDPASVAEKVTERTKAVMPVHLFGLCADMDGLRAVLPKHVKIVEDGACAAGASAKGTPAGALGDAGAITTDSEILADKVKTLRNYGSKVKYYNEVQGYNSRLDELQAAVLGVKLLHLEAENDRRRVIDGCHDRRICACGRQWVRTVIGYRQVDGV